MEIRIRLSYIISLLLLQVNLRLRPPKKTIVIKAIEETIQPPRLLMPRKLSKKTKTKIKPRI